MFRYDHKGLVVVGPYHRLRRPHGTLPNLLPLSNDPRHISESHRNYRACFSWDIWQPLQGPRGPSTSSFLSYGCSFSSEQLFISIIIISRILDITDRRNVHWRRNPTLKVLRPKSSPTPSASTHLIYTGLLHLVHLSLLIHVPSTLMTILRDRRLEYSDCSFIVVIFFVSFPFSASLVLMIPDWVLMEFTLIQVEPNSWLLSWDVLKYSS